MHETPATAMSAGVVGHFLPQAQRSHVGPHVFDVVETLGLQSSLTDLDPPERKLSVSRPDRILLLMIDDYRVDRSVFAFVIAHRCPLPPPKVSPAATTLEHGGRQPYHVRLSAEVSPISADCVLNRCCGLCHDAYR